jgi:hypothetical protein
MTLKQLEDVLLTRQGECAATHAAGGQDPFGLCEPGGC